MEPREVHRFSISALRRRVRFWRVSEWLAASLEMKCPVRGCGFDSRALRSEENAGPYLGSAFFLFLVFPFQVENAIGKLTMNLLP